MEGLTKDGTTRAGFLRKAGLGGAAIVGSGALAGSLVGTARAGDPNDNVADVDVLNYALTLEYLEAEFYTQALGGPGTTGVPGATAKLSSKAFRTYSGLLKRGPGISKTAYAYLSAIRDHEVAHVDFLVSALGSAAVPPATFNFASGIKDVGTFLATAKVLENTGVMAYDGAIRYIDKGDYLQAGAQIATVEARHASYLNLVTGTSPFPTPFDAGKKPSEILAAIKPFLVTVPAQVTALFTRLP